MTFALIWACSWHYEIRKDSLTVYQKSVHSQVCDQVAAEVLQGGGVVAVPTDTIYGLACLVQHPAAVDRLYTIKVN